MSIIFLNGCTSAGKSSLALHLQNTLPEPHLLTGIDAAFDMLPAHLHNHSVGFYFERSGDAAVQLKFGAFGLRALKAHHRAAAAIARSGVNLILDEVVLTPELRDDWARVLDGLDVFMVGVHCDLDELQRREIARGDRMIGQARGQFGHVHDGMLYDIDVDTTRISPEAAASRVFDVVSQTASGKALARMRERLGKKRRQANDPRRKTR